MLVSDHNVFNVDIMKILTKINESLLKNIAGTATTTDSQSNCQSLWMNPNNFMNMMQEEDSKDNYLEQSNFMYIFDVLTDTLGKIINDFNHEEQISINSTINSKLNRVLGLKKYCLF